MQEEILWEVGQGLRSPGANKKHVPILFVDLGETSNQLSDIGADTEIFYLAGIDPDGMHSIDGAGTVLRRCLLLHSGARH